MERTEKLYEHKNDEIKIVWDENITSALVFD